MMETQAAGASPDRGDLADLPSVTPAPGTPSSNADSAETQAQPEQPPAAAPSVPLQMVEHAEPTAAPAAEPAAVAPAEPTAADPSAASTAPEAEAKPEPKPPLEFYGAPPRTFEAMGIHPEVLRALLEMGWKGPMPVQSQVFRPVLAKRDLIVQSRTGSGKTAAFGIPFAQGLIDPRINCQGGRIQGLVLGPTRELALQVASEVGKIAGGRGLSVVPVYGGAPMGRQVEQLKEGGQIVSGTPGRVLDHLRRGTLHLSSLRVLVLDEADEMLSMGFYEDIIEIIKRCPKERQTLLFSATMPEEVESISRRHMAEPLKIQLSADFVSAQEITHAYYMVSGVGRPRDLMRVLEAERPESAVIFCNTREETSLVAEFLRGQGLDAEAISSDLTQADRERVMGRSKQKRLKYLVATDIAARGIDISDLSHVINYTFPESSEVYIHRTGRTGRAGKSGVAVSLIGPRELGNFYYLKLMYKIRPVERVIPTEEDLQTLREGQQLTRLCTELGHRPEAPWRSLLKRVLASDDGERILANLLDRYLSGRHADTTHPVSAVSHEAPRHHEPRHEAPRHHEPRRVEGDRGRRDRFEEEYAESPSRQRQRMERMAASGATPSEPEVRSEEGHRRDHRPEGRRPGPRQDGRDFRDGRRPEGRPEGRYEGRRDGRRDDYRRDDRPRDDRPRDDRPRDDRPRDDRPRDDRRPRPSHNPPVVEAGVAPAGAEGVKEPAPQVQVEAANPSPRPEAVAQPVVVVEATPEPKAEATVAPAPPAPVERPEPAQAEAVQAEPVRPEPVQAVPVQAAEPKAEAPREASAETPKDAEGTTEDDEERKRRRRSSRGRRRPEGEAGRPARVSPPGPDDIIEVKDGRDFWEAWVDSRTPAEEGQPEGKLEGATEEAKADTEGAAPQALKPEGRPRPQRSPRARTPRQAAPAAPAAQAQAPLVEGGEPQAASAEGSTEEDRDDANGDGRRRRRRSSNGESKLPLGTGEMRLYLNLGRRDGLDEAQLASLLQGQGLPVFSSEVRSTHSYLAVPETQVDGVLQKLNGHQHGERNLVCERARR